MPMGDNTLIALAFAFRAEKSGLWLSLLWRWSLFILPWSPSAADETVKRSLQGECFTAEFAYTKSITALGE